MFIWECVLECSLIEKYKALSLALRTLKYFFFFNNQIRDREKRFVTRFLITKMDLQMLKCQKNNEQIFE